MATMHGNLGIQMMATFKEEGRGVGRGTGRISLENGGVVKPGETSSRQLGSKEVE